MDEIEAHIHYDDYDFNNEHPTLVITGDRWVAGYSVDVATGALSRCCICMAHSANECVCGYDEDDV